MPLDRRMFRFEYSMGDSFYQRQLFVIKNGSRSDVSIGNEHGACITVMDTKRMIEVPIGPKEVAGMIEALQKCQTNQTKNKGG